MKHFCSAAMLLASLIISCGKRDERVRIISYNIHHGEGIDSVYNVPRIAEFLRGENADVIGLQEVDSSYSDRSRNEAQPRLFRETLGWNSFYGPNIRENYGNLTLSRFPILRAYNESLPNPDNKEPRGVIVAEIALPGMTVMFLNTHLCAFSVANRVAQISKIIDVVSGFDKPCIVVGDFNSRLSGQLKPFIDSGFLISSRQILGLEEGIDDVFVSPVLKSAVIDGRIVDKSYSDHPALIVDLNIAK